MIRAYGVKNGDGNFDWTDALTDALIMAGVSAFACLTGIGAVGLISDPAQTVLAVLIAAGSTFVGVLAVKRGLTREDAKDSG